MLGWAVVAFALLWVLLGALGWLGWRLVRRLEDDERGPWEQGL